MICIKKSHFTRIQWIVLNFATAASFAANTSRSLLHVPALQLLFCWALCSGCEAIFCSQLCSKLCRQLLQPAVHFLIFPPGFDLGGAFARLGFLQQSGPVSQSNTRTLEVVHAPTFLRFSTSIIEDVLAVKVRERATRTISTTSHLLNDLECISIRFKICPSQILKWQGLRPTNATASVGISFVRIYIVWKNSRPT